MSVPRQLALDLLQPPAPSLTNFVAGRNAEALATLQKLAQGIATEKLVYLWGEAGCGRSHLLHALAATPGARFFNGHEAPDAAGVTLLDDVDQLDAPTQIALFNRINAVRGRTDAASVTAGATPPAQLALREDLRTRLAWGLVYQLQPLSDEEKAEALQSQAAARGLTIAADVIPFLLTHLPRDMGTLSAALEALDRYALAQQRSLSVALVRQWLGHSAT